MYESLADLLGRGIRYGEPAPTPSTQGLVSQLQELSVVHIRNLERGRNKFLELEDAAHSAWQAVSRFDPGTPEEAEMRMTADHLSESVREMRKTVSDSEIVVKASIDFMKSQFDSLRAEGK